MKMLDTAAFLRKKLAVSAQKYTFVECNTEALIEESHRLRHQVYCEEMGWEEKNQTQFEQDCYDAASKHFIAIEKRSGKSVATFRIIDTDSLPICELDILDSAHEKHPNSFLNGQRCELSRFSILKEYRSTDLTDSLMLYSAYASVNLGYLEIYSMMEVKFANKLKKFQLFVSQLTDTFEHRGARAIYHINHSHVANLLANILRSDNEEAEYNPFCNHFVGAPEPVQACA
jgi:N-acyl-L-homoserine lactone synthetase